MLRTIGKTLVGAIAVMCLVSTLAVAAEITCAKDDGKGTCTAAVGRLMAERSLWSGQV